MPIWIIMKIYEYVPILKLEVPTSIEKLTKYYTMIRQVFIFLKNIQFVYIFFLNYQFLLNLII